MLEYLLFADQLTVTVKGILGQAQDRQYKA